MTNGAILCIFGHLSSCLAATRCCILLVVILTLAVRRSVSLLCIAVLTRFAFLFLSTISSFVGHEAAIVVSHTKLIVHGRATARVESILSLPQKVGICSGCGTLAFRGGRSLRIVI